MKRQQFLYLFDKWIIKCHIAFRLVCKLWWLLKYSQTNAQNSRYHGDKGKAQCMGKREIFLVNISTHITSRLGLVWCCFISIRLNSCLCKHRYWVNHMVCLCVPKHTIYWYFYVRCCNICTYTCSADMVVWVKMRVRACAFMSVCVCEQHVVSTWMRAYACVWMFEQATRKILKMAAPIVTRESKRRNKCIHKATYIQREMEKKTVHVFKMYDTRKKLTRDMCMELEFHNWTQSNSRFAIEFCLILCELEIHLFFSSRTFRYLVFVLWNAKNTIHRCIFFLQRSHMFDKQYEYIDEFGN